VFALAAAVHLPDRVQAIRLVAPLAPIDSEVGTTQVPEGQASRLKMLSRLPVNQRQLSRLVHFTIRSEVKRRRADPEAFLQRVSDRSPADGQALEDPEVWDVCRANVVSAVTQGGGGWADDVSVVLTPWGVDLSTVEQPVQLWHGTKDVDIGPTASEYFADRLPNCTLTEVEGGGHLGTLFALWRQLLAPLSAR
jgi:pimeloyl-ACP methyl ester carboxylesterase